MMVVVVVPNSIGGGVPDELMIQVMMDSYVVDSQLL